MGTNVTPLLNFCKIFFDDLIYFAPGGCFCGEKADKKRRNEEGVGVLQMGIVIGNRCGGETYLMAGNPRGYWVSRITLNSQLCNLLYL